MKKIIPVTILLVLIITAGGLLAWRILHQQTQEEAEQEKTVRLYYPNANFDDLDPTVLKEERAYAELWTWDEEKMEMIYRSWPSHGNMICAGDYAYVERTVSTADFSLEKGLNLLFANKLTDEERQLGFYNELDGLAYVSHEMITDTEREIPDNLGSAGMEYLKLVISDSAGYFTTGGGEPFERWMDESDYLGGACFIESVLSQIVATANQFYPACIDYARSESLEENPNLQAIYMVCDYEN